MDVSVIIVNWNTRQVTCDCLASLYRQRTDLAFEVIVVDNASSDDSVVAIQHEFPQTRLIVNDENRGFAAANNQGIAVAAGRYVLLLNSDTIVFDRVMDQVVGYADCHPDVGIVGCRVLNADRALQPTCFMYPSLLNMFLWSTYLYKLFPRHRFFGRERMTWWKRDEVREVEVVTGCFMLVRRLAIDRVGILDEAFFIYGEETDWCFRMQRAGWRGVFVPFDGIVHLGGASTQQVAGEMSLQLKAGVLQFIHKHKSYGIYLLSCMLMGAFLALRLPMWMVKAIFCRGQRRRSWSYVVTYAKGLWRLMRGWRGLRGAFLRTEQMAAVETRDVSATRGGM